MHLGCSTTGKSLSLIVIEDSFHRIIQMLDHLKESENGVFEGYGVNHNWTHKSYLWNSLMQNH
jgi:hypothetical protein